MEPNWSELPRLNELYQESNLNEDLNYFSQAISKDVLTLGLAKNCYQQLEIELQTLDNTSWLRLKKKVIISPYIYKFDKLRGYQQLFNILNEVKGYIYLKDQGYKEIWFIPETKSRTPDLAGRNEHGLALVEVKTISQSQDDLETIRNNSQGHSMQVRDAIIGLPQSLKNKIIDTVEEAREQLSGYNPEAENRINRRIAYLHITLDINCRIHANNLSELDLFINSLNTDQQEVIYEFHF